MRDEGKIVGSRGLPAESYGIPLDFGVALEALKNGKAIWRKGWGNENRVRMIKAPIGESKEGRFIVFPGVFDGDGFILDTWHPSPSDLLAEDWHFE